MRHRIHVIGRALRKRRIIRRRLPHAHPHGYVGEYLLVRFDITARINTELAVVFAWATARIWVVKWHRARVAEFGHVIGGVIWHG